MRSQVDLVDREQVGRLDPEAALDWAWDHLAPTSVESLEVGSGLDVGYVRGFHAAEKDSQGKPFRWTTDSAQVRSVLPSGAMNVEWNAWRPQGPPPAAPVVTLSSGAAGLNTGPLPTQDRWVTTEVAGPGPGDGAGVQPLTLRVNPFVGAGSDPRLLGVRLSRVGSPSP